MRDATETARAVAAYDLLGTTIEPPGPIEPEDWPVTLAQLEHDKLTGIAVAAAEDGWLPLKAEQFDDLVERHRDAMAWCLKLERLLLDVAGAFGSDGIEFLVLKGPAVARVAYPDPSWRVFHDLDLLVRTEDWRRAVAVLERDFGPRRIPEPRPGWDERFGKGAVFLTTEGQQVDLHRTLAEGAFAQWDRSDDLFARAETLQISGRALERPDLPGLLFHACLHAALDKGGDSTSTLRDIGALATIRPSVVPDVVSDLALPWRADRAVQLALVRTTTMLALPTLKQTSVRVRRDGLQERAIRARHQGGSPVQFHITTLRAIPSPTSKAAYLRAILTPRHGVPRTKRVDTRASLLRHLTRPRRAPEPHRASEGSIR
jgi:hypothetical protein